MNRLPFTIVQGAKFRQPADNAPTKIDNVPEFSLVNSILIVACSAMLGVLLAYLV